MPDSDGYFTISGAEELTQRLAQMAKNIPEKVAKALYTEAQGLRRISMSRTPVDTGALRGSHEVEKPQVSGRDISVKIVVGGPAAPYAPTVHEDLTIQHDEGEAKFLERTMYEAVGYIGENIANAIDMERMNVL